MRVFDLATDARIRRLERRLPPATLAACHRVAWRMRWRLPDLLACPDWQAALVREARTQLALEPGVVGKQPIIAALLMVIVAVIMIVAAVTTSEKTQQQQTEEKLKQTAQSLLDDAERHESADQGTGKYYLEALPHSYREGTGSGGYASVLGRRRP